MIDIAKIDGFDWDVGNARKNDKHGVCMAEWEQPFFNSPLHIAFTLRDEGKKIRVISARDMHRKEREIYEKTP